VEAIINTDRMTKCTTDSKKGRDAIYSSLEPVFLISCHYPLVKVRPFRALELGPSKINNQQQQKVKTTCSTKLKGAQSRFAHTETFSPNFSNSSFVIRVNLLHP